MSRTTATFTVSLPPEMMALLDDAMKREHRTRSELVREALRQYLIVHRSAQLASNLASDAA
jgi:metal-responsive CopG/Arc/MetJ family transcriptional regulator